MISPTGTSSLRRPSPECWRSRSTRFERGSNESARLSTRWSALELTGIAVVTSAAHAGELELDESARRLMADVVSGDEHLYQLLARRPGDGRLARRAEVSLRSGARALLHAHTEPLEHGALVSVLELQREHPGIDRHLLGALTPRASQVAALVADGPSDREIAEALHLSRFTVHQHVKHVYRTLGVDSRVALTRLLLARPLPGAAAPNSLPNIRDRTISSILGRCQR